MRIKFLVICLPLASALWLQPAVGERPDNAAAHSRFAGVYRSEPNDGGKWGPSMNVSLGHDGTATVTEDPGPGAKTRFGHWNDSGSQVRVVFDQDDDRRAEPAMVFQPSHDGLQAITWNHASWGSEEPPPMKKGFKVKTTYWLTSVR